MSKSISHFTDNLKRISADLGDAQRMPDTELFERLDALTPDHGKIYLDALHERVIELRKKDRIEATKEYLSWAFALGLALACILVGGSW